MTQAIKFIFGSVPKDGGTFTFYRTLRPQLFPYEIDTRCVAVGQSEARFWDDDFADEGCFCIAKKAKNVKKQAIIFVDWCMSHDVDIVMGFSATSPNDCGSLGSFKQKKSIHLNLPQISSTTKGESLL